MDNVESPASPTARLSVFVLDAAALTPGCGASSPGILPTCIAAAVSPASSVVVEKFLIVSEDLTALIVRQNADIASDANTCVTISRSNRRQWLQQQQHGFITLRMDKLIIPVKDLIKKVLCIQLK